MESEWVGHAHNRSELLRRASHDCDYILMLDADMELVQDAPLPALTADAYLIRIKDRALEYPLPLLTKASLPYFYAGVAHSYLACSAPHNPPELLHELHLLDHGGGGHREGKIEQDAALLGAEVAKNPLDRRSWFYLAQSYRDLGQIDKAIACYRMRASLGGWDEEVYNALYAAGTLLCENVSYHEGAPLLLEAFKLKPNRAEALRALAGSTTSVADKIPFPKEDLLFVRPSAYTYQEPAPERPMEVIKPTTPPPQRKRRNQRAVTQRVSFVLITRGNVPLDVILQDIPFPDVVVWNNAEKDEDYGTLGRFLALEQCKHPVVAFQDDDVLFTEWQPLLDEYERGRIVCNMNPNWVQACGYDDLAMQGAGAVADKDLYMPAIDAYRDAYPDEAEIRVMADFVVGTIIPHRKVDLGYIAREFADDPDRLYRQPGHQERKERVRAQARRVRDMLQDVAA